MTIPHRPERLRAFLCAALIGFILLAVGPGLSAQDPDKEMAKKLQGFDAYMAKILKDWNAPGIGVGIVAGDKLVFAKGYGYRITERNSPTPRRPSTRSPRTLSSSRPWPPAFSWTAED
jgi:CubicO group peptidase (beta-lactamase class C family)